MTTPLNDQDFKRVMTILFDVWTKAGEQAKENGLTGNDIVRAQETTMTAFLDHCQNVRKGHK